MKNAKTITMNTVGLNEAARSIGGAARIMPGAVARGLNATMHSARNLIIEAAKERYAMNAAGERHLDDLKERELASASRLKARMSIKKLKSDMGYYESNPSVPLMGMRWRQAPSGGYAGHVLRSTPLTTMGGKGNLSKAFLVHFKSGHTGMVQRIMGRQPTYGADGRKLKPSKEYTENGFRRWKNAAGEVEKLQTLGAASAAAQAGVVWPSQERESVETMFRQLSLIMNGG